MTPGAAGAGAEVAAGIGAETGAETGAGAGLGFGRLDRLLRPRSVAVIGGGAWCAAVVEGRRALGHDGPLHVVHPRAAEIGGLRALRRLADLPEPPDAAFIGVNRRATVEIVAELAAMGAGGAVCFASGFSEAEAEDPDGAALQAALREAAGAMPFLGPNCYGFINYLDGAALWPDQHGGARVARGVAALTQSSNVALNLSMQRRGLPLAFLGATGNQAQTGFAELGAALLADDRITALGLHVEGVGDLRGLERLAAEAAARGKAIVALKVGRSAEARAATVSHTASLAGDDAGAQALFARLGIGRADTPAEFLEALKLLHACGPLPSTRIASLSCSGGEASLMADLGAAAGVTFPPLDEAQRRRLAAALGPMVALANPLDYHTFVWRDVEAMTEAFAAIARPDLALAVVVLDFPRADRCDGRDWALTVEAVLRARARSGMRFAVLSSLPETMPEDVAARLAAEGVPAFCGMAEGLAAIRIAATPRPAAPAPALIGRAPKAPATLTEAEAKAALAAHGLAIPEARRADGPEAAAEAAAAIGFPVALKGEGAAHKTEAGAVALGLGDAAATLRAARAMPADRFLVERMLPRPVAELLVGVVRDPAHGFVLTLAAGGVTAELLEDRASLIVPATRREAAAALSRLRVSRLLDGWRGAPAADRDAVVAAVMAVQAYVVAAPDGLAEVEVNPLFCLPDRAVAVDALIRRDPPDATEETRP